MLNSSASTDRTISLSGGRTLGYREFGDPTGTPVLALHGTPGSRLKFADCDDVAAKLGLRLISIDRWGYGLTSAHAQPTLALFGDDMIALADSIGAGRCLVTGVSGGGPFAVAAAAALQSRCMGLALISPVGIVDRATRLSPFHAVCFRVLPRLPGAIRLAFRLFRTTLRLAPNSTMVLALSRAPAIDRMAIFEAPIRHRLAKTFANGLAPGVSGPVIDMALFTRDWGVDLGAITAPVRIWIGTADRNVPQDGVRRLAMAIVATDLVTLPGEGHLWIARNSEDVLRWLACQAGGIKSK